MSRGKETVYTLNKGVCLVTVGEFKMNFAPYSHCAVELLLRYYQLGSYDIKTKRAAAPLGI